jgi:sialic acid synthase SpsE
MKSEQPCISIEARKIGINEPPSYIAAELSSNHNDNIETACKIIEAAKQLVAYAVKLQTYLLDTMTIDCDRNDFYIHGGL